LVYESHRLPQLWQTRKIVECCNRCLDFCKGFREFEKIRSNKAFTTSWTASMTVVLPIQNAGAILTYVFPCASWYNPIASTVLGGKQSLNIEFCLINLGPRILRIISNVARFTLNNSLKSLSVTFKSLLWSIYFPCERFRSHATQTSSSSSLNKRTGGRVMQLLDTLKSLTFHFRAPFSFWCFCLQTRTALSIYSLFSK